MRSFASLVCWGLLTASLWATEPRPVVLDPTYEHDRFVTIPGDIVRQERAFTTSFDSADDNDGDGEGDRWGIPEWVAYQMKQYPGGVPSAFESRPSPWITDQTLVEAGIAPHDDSYKNSGYSRGHMCMREHARRLGKDADFNTHTVLNSCPQLQGFNAGAWLGLENMCSKWADAYGSVWIICGPIVEGTVPTEWIGDGDEVPVAVPHKFFKIVARESGNPELPDVLAFIYPHDETLSSSSLNFDHAPFLTSVDDIEAQTGLDFFTIIPVEFQAQFEPIVATELWPLEAVFFAPAAPGPLLEEAPSMLPQEAFATPVDHLPTQTSAGAFPFALPLTGRYASVDRPSRLN